MLIGKQKDLLLPAYNLAPGAGLRVIGWLCSQRAKSVSWFDGPSLHVYLCIFLLLTSFVPLSFPASQVILLHVL